MIASGNNVEYRCSIDFCAFMEDLRIRLRVFMEIRIFGKEVETKEKIFSFIHCIVCIFYIFLRVTHSA